MEPKYTEYPLKWTPEMAERVTSLASARHMTMNVWIREAIREKLERDKPGSGPEDPVAQM